MGWVEWPLADPIIFTAPYQWQELVAAIDERDKAIGGDGYGNPLAFKGEHWFSSGNVAKLQTRIENLVANYVDHTDNSGNWDGVFSADFAPYWVWGGGGAHDITSAAHANVGNGNGTWTRKLGTKGTTTAYGRAEAGDCGAHWLNGSTVDIVPFWNEMYRVLNLLRWTKLTAEFFTPGTGAKNIQSVVEWTDTSFDKAWGEATGAWPGYFNTRSPGGKAGQAWRWSQLDYASGLEPDPYRATLDNRRGYIQLKNATDKWAGRKARIDYYAFGNVTFAWEPLMDWDDNGLNYDHNVMNLLESLTGSDNNRMRGSMYGDFVDHQERPTGDPASGDPNATRGWGLLVDNASPTTGPAISHTAILKWDGSGGFKKIA